VKVTFWLFVQHLLEGSLDNIAGAERQELVQGDVFKKDMLMVRVRNTGANMMTPRTTSIPEVDTWILIRAS